MESQNIFCVLTFSLFTLVDRVLSCGNLALQTAAICPPTQGTLKFDVIVSIFANPKIQIPHPHFRLCLHYKSRQQRHTVSKYPQPRCLRFLSLSSFFCLVFRPSPKFPGLPPNFLIKESCKQFAEQPYHSLTLSCNLAPFCKKDALISPFIFHYFDITFHIWHRSQSSQHNTLVTQMFVRWGCFHIELSCLRCTWLHYNEFFWTYKWYRFHRLSWMMVCPFWGKGGKRLELSSSPYDATVECILHWEWTDM